MIFYHYTFGNFFSGQNSRISPELKIFQNIYWHLECCNDDMYDHVSMIITVFMEIKRAGFSRRAHHDYSLTYSKK